MPTEKRPPIARQAFQPSRSRLLQPSDLFKKPSPQNASAQLQSPTSARPSNSNPAPQIPNPNAQSLSRPQPHINTQSKSRNQPSNHQNDATHSNPENEPIPRIPRLSSRSPSSSSDPKSTFPKTGNPFVSTTARNPYNNILFLSGSQVKSHSFPLRSANQPVLRSPNQPALLKSKNQQPTPPPTHSTPPAVPKETATSRPLSQSRQSSETPVRDTHNAHLAPVTLNSRRGNLTESKHLQESTTSIPNPAPPILADVSVQQAAVPFPLSTLPAHVLQAMSQDKREGYLAGWSDGWDARGQCMRNRQKDAAALLRSSASGHVASPQQVSPLPTNVQCSPALQPSPDQHTSSHEQSQTHSPVKRGSTSRRRLSDPYADDEPCRDQISVGSNKRPRTSPSANQNTRARSSRQATCVPQSAPSATCPRNPRPTNRAKSPDIERLSDQNSRHGASPRMSGEDAYLARARLGDMRSVNHAFAAVTTSSPVDLRSKKRQRRDAREAADGRQPADERSGRDTQREDRTESRLDPRQGIESRHQRHPQPLRAEGSRHEPGQLANSLMQDDMQASQRSSGSDTRCRLGESQRRESERLSEKRGQQGFGREAEVRSRQGPGYLTTATDSQQPGWLSGSRARPSTTLATPSLPKGINAGTTWRPSETRDSGRKVSQAQGVTPHANRRQEQCSHSVNGRLRTTGRLAQSSVEGNCLQVRSKQYERAKQSLPHQAAINGARPDVDMEAPDSEEESGWGTALNAATSCERVPTNSMDKNARKAPVVPNVAIGVSQQTLQVESRDPRRKQRLRPRAETAEKNAVSLLALKQRDDITVQAYAERFGLVIVERDQESGKVEWVACKFCPVFGCRTRDPNYIMAHRAPFSSRKFIAHLEKDHCVKWKEYTQANAKEKGQFFSGKVLPAKAFRDRIAELKRSQDGIARRPVAPVITAPAENALIDKAIERMRKKKPITKTTSIAVPSIDDCWIGTKKFRDQTNIENTVLAQSLPLHASAEKLPSLEGISKCFKEVEINSNIAGLILHGLLRHPEAYDQYINCYSGFTDTVMLVEEGPRAATFLFTSMDKRTLLRIALALRYLYDGKSGIVCMALWQNAPEIKVRGASGDNSGKEVFGHGNSIMGLGMHIVSRALAANCRNWALGLKTRCCQYVTGNAVEVLMSLHDDKGAMQRVHLVTVLNVNGAGKAVTDVLDVVFPCWKERLIGLHSGICKEKEEQEKRIEGAILEKVRKESGRKVVVVEHDVCVDENPIFPWGLSKMSESKFNCLLSNIEVPLGFALGKARLEAAKAQRKELFSRVISGADERELFRESWEVAGEKAAEIYVVAEGLRTIWMCDCLEDREVVKRGQRRGSDAVVDCEAERVLWARELVKLWQSCKDVVSELGMESPYVAQTV